MEGLVLGPGTDWAAKGIKYCSCPQGVSDPSGDQIYVINTGGL